jgi:hypothetical protein
MEKIYWKKAIKLLKNHGNISQDEIDFNEEQIPVNNVNFLNQHNIRVPQNLIFYDDENIDCSDIPEITQEDIENGKIQWIKTDEFPLDNEVRNWIVKQNIKLNELIPQLIQNFYNTIKHIKNNAAL